MLLGAESTAGSGDPVRVVAGDAGRVMSASVRRESASWMTSFTAFQFGRAGQPRSWAQVPGRLHSVIASGPSSASMIAETGISSGALESA